MKRKSKLVGTTIEFYVWHPKGVKPERVAFLMDKLIAVGREDARLTVDCPDPNQDCTHAKEALKLEIGAAWVQDLAGGFA